LIAPEFSLHSDQREIEKMSILIDFLDKWRPSLAAPRVRTLPPMDRRPEMD
jgi:hypothetical protein